jgi:hypothetical protein
MRSLVRLPVASATLAGVGSASPAAHPNANPNANGNRRRVRQHA